MVTYHRAVTLDGDTVAIEFPHSDEILNSYLWVDPEPLDLRPAQYTDTRLVKLGDKVCCGGDEFIVANIRPALNDHPFGQIRAEIGPWYGAEYAVVLGCK